MPSTPTQVTLKEPAKEEAKTGMSTRPDSDLQLRGRDGQTANDKEADH